MIFSGEKVEYKISMLNPSGVLNAKVSADGQD